MHETDTSVCISGKPDQAVLGKRLASDQVQINPSALKRPKRKSAFLSELAPTLTQETPDNNNDSSEPVAQQSNDLTPEDGSQSKDSQLNLIKV